MLSDVIYQLRSDYLPFCDQYTMPHEETPHFLNGHPKRLLSLDDLVDVHLANFQSLLEHRDIHRLRSQLNALPPDGPDKGTWLLRLADVLSRRFWQLSQKDDLEEAIWYYEEALSLLPKRHYHFLEAILGFCSCVYQRFQLLGHLDDLKKLLVHLHTEQNLNFESLLTPVKAQLHFRSQQFTQKFSKLHNQMGNSAQPQSSHDDHDFVIRSAFPTSSPVSRTFSHLSNLPETTVSSSFRTQLFVGNVVLFFFFKFLASNMYIYSFRIESDGRTWKIFSEKLALSCAQPSL